MKRFLPLTALVFGFMMFMSCQQAPSLLVSGPRSFNFTRDGGSQSITFTCNRDWSVSSTESWVTVFPSSGTPADGEVAVKINCAPNTTYDARSATITVKVEDLSESITITQDTGIGLIVSPKTFDLTNAEQVIEIEVQKNVQYTVAIDNESAKWIKQGGTKALTTDKISFTIAANTAYDNREGKIVFKQLDGDLTETVTIRQNQTNGLFITTSTYNLSNEAHTLSVEVKANVVFEVTSQANWITYVETKALTASTIVLDIPANTSYDNRIGTVLVKQTNGDLSGIITINQNQTDFLAVTPTSLELSNLEQSVEITVSQNVDYSVVIPDDARTWVAVQGDVQTKGVVDDKVVLYFAKNTTYDDRETSVTIKQVDGSLAETVKIKQAYGEGLITDKAVYEINRYGGSLDIGIQANVDYEVATEANWIHYIATKALTASTVVLTIDENPSYTPREATVVIKQKSGGLVANVTVKQTPFGEVEFEGDTYKTVKYGDREWFAENLRAKFGFEEGEHLNENGDRIWPTVGSVWAEKDGELLYSMEELVYSEKMKGKSVCPEGWHISTKEDWEGLFSMSSSMAAAPFLQKELGGTDDFSFGGTYGKWHQSSFWLEMWLCTLFEDCAFISNSDGAYVETRSANQRHFPAEDFRYIRCVRGPVAPIIQTLPVIKQTTSTAELRLSIFNDPNGIYFNESRLNLHSKITKITFKYGISKDNLSSTIVSNNAEWTVNISGLNPSTTYYFRPEVEYEGGDTPIYGDIMSFKTYYGTIEYQGDTYFTTLLSNVEFMSQNLRSTELNDGTPIPLLAALSDWSTAEGPGQCIAFNRDDYLEPMGRLYNGYALQTGKVCPEGWRLPKYSEIFNETNGRLYEESLNTGSLFQADTHYWANPVFCNNELALSLLPSGYRNTYSSWGAEEGFQGQYWMVYLWALDDSNSNSLSAVNGILQLGIEGNITPYRVNEESAKHYGYAVRCVREK